MTCGIYMIQNKVNGKIYIGQAVDIEKRWRRHKCELRSNRHDNEHLQRSWNNYGESNFEFTVICECDENQLNTMEESYISKLRTYDNIVGYNKTYGGGGCRPTEETKEKMRESKKGKYIGGNNPFYGKHHKEETIEKMKEAKKGKYGGENNPNYGKHPSEETIEKIRKANRGKIPSEETKKKISEANKGENNGMYGKHGAENPNSIPVVQLTLEGELVNVYDSAKEAGKNGFNPCNITNCIKGKQKNHKGYKWMYLSEYISKLHPNIKTINLMGKTYEVNQEEVKIK